MVRPDHFSYEVDLFQNASQEHEWLIWNTCDICQCFLQFGYLFRYVYKYVCRFLSFLWLIVSAFCKRLIAMTMYMWLITLQKRKQSGSGSCLWFEFYVVWSFSIGIWIVLTICHTKWTFSKRESGSWVLNMEPERYFWVSASADLNSGIPVLQWPRSRCLMPPLITRAESYSRCTKMVWAKMATDHYNVVCPLTSPMFAEGPPRATPGLLRCRKLFT